LFFIILISLIFYKPMPFWNKPSQTSIKKVVKAQGHYRCLPEPSNVLIFA
jgi:hypothetical protein